MRYLLVEVLVLGGYYNFVTLFGLDSDALGCQPDAAESVRGQLPIQLLPLEVHQAQPVVAYDEHPW